MKWLKALFGKKETPVAPAKVETTSPSCVGEPILAFVRTVKAQPNRFKCRIVSDPAKQHPWHRQHGFNLYTLKDMKLGFVHCFALNGEGKLYSVQGEGWINFYEMRYMQEELQGILSRGLKTLQERYRKMAEADRIAEQKQRDARRDQWKDVYQ